MKTGPRSQTKKSAHRGLNVLLVVADAERREQIGGWLSSEGHEVRECPGPLAPDYTCLGGRRRDCPLARDVDAVVLDLSLASDQVATGTPSWQLLDYYLERGHPVVAISAPDQQNRFFLDDRVITLQRPGNREEILAAVDYLVEKRSTVEQIGTFRLTPRRDGRIQ